MCVSDGGSGFTTEVDACAVLVAACPSAKYIFPGNYFNRFVEPVTRVRLRAPSASFDAVVSSSCVPGVVGSSSHTHSVCHRSILRAKMISCGVSFH